MYAAYQNMKSSGGPKDEADLKAWIKEYDPNKLSMMKIDANNLDGLFTSERDGKPFKVRYKVGGGRGSVSAVVFEQEGVNGKKQVGFTGGRVDEVDDATYNQLWPARFHPLRRSRRLARRARGRKAGRHVGAPKGPGQ